MDAPVDLRPLLREAHADADPETLQAIDDGLDVAELERNLTLTVEERILQMDEMLAFLASLRAGMPHAPAER